jgi:sporulation protein YlmC with PRC-barrel domain
MNKEMPPMTPGADQSAQRGTESTGQSGQMQAAEWTGLSVYGSDDQEIGEVAEVQMGSDGQPQSLTVKTGQALGLGERTVEIESDKFQKSGNRIILQMTSDEVKELPSTSQSK